MEIYLYSFLGLTVIILLILWINQNRKMKRVLLQLEHADLLLARIQPHAALEGNLNVLLELFAGIVDAPGYAFYLLHDKQQRFVLKAVRYKSNDRGQIAPSYSGLIPFKGEDYQPPLSLATNVEPVQLGIIKDGQVPLLHIPIRGGKGLIRVGPIAGISRQTKFLIEKLAEKLPAILELLVETEEMKLRTEIVATSENALRTLCTMALDSEAILKKTLGMSASALGISSGLILVQEAGRYRVPALIGFSRETERRLQTDTDWGRALWNLLGQREMMVIAKSDQAYKRIPAAVRERGAEAVIVSKCMKAMNGLLLCTVDSAAATAQSMEQLLASIRSLSSQLSILSDVQEGLKPVRFSYMELLKALSRTIDNLNPYTVGYSELMSRYSIVIAKELGLSQKEIQDIAFAAYVSNIGVIGLSEELYLKEGKYTETEFEKMKLHAEVGAVIIEMTLGNKAVAAYIRHHHERIDGNGYPAGLKGQEIPLGARIIAVVQTFLAKINGRRYRDPLAFQQALDLLDSAAGSHLDAAVVKAFLNWFKKKQNAAIAGRALGPCWEMCVSPVEICASCPAYNQTDKNCWEMEKNNCLSHGKSCETCFVYTEALARRTAGRVPG